MGIYEQLSGARMHAAYILPGGVSQDLTPDIAEKIYDICLTLGQVLNSIDALLSFNRI